MYGGITAELIPASLAGRDEPSAGVGVEM